jgi:hypothetical protein
LERASLKVIRASNYLARVRQELLTLQRRIDDTSDAIGRGELWPKERPKKAKHGRRIEL